MQGLLESIAVESLTASRGDLSRGDEKLLGSARVICTCSIGPIFAAVSPSRHLKIHPIAALVPESRSSVDSVLVQTLSVVGTTHAHLELCPDLAEHLPFSFAG